MISTALPMTSAARFSPLGPRGVFQILPQPISIGNMHTLAVFKDRSKLFETSDVASDQFRGRDRGSLASKDDFAFCDMSLRLRQSPLNKIAVHAANHTMVCIGNTNSPHLAQLFQQHIAPIGSQTPRRFTSMGCIMQARSSPSWRRAGRVGGLGQACAYVWALSSGVARRLVAPLSRSP